MCLLPNNTQSELLPRNYPPSLVCLPGMREDLTTSSPSMKADEFLEVPSPILFFPLPYNKSRSWPRTQLEPDSYFCHADSNRDEPRGEMLEFIHYKDIQMRRSINTCYLHCLSLHSTLSHALFPSNSLIFHPGCELHDMPPNKFLLFS